MNCIDKYLNCELPPMPVGIDKAFLAKISDDTAKCLSDKILKQAFAELKTDVQRHTSLKKHKLTVPSCFDCTANASSGEASYSGNYLYVNYYKIPSKQIQPVTVNVVGVTKDGNVIEFEQEVTTGVNIPLNEVFTALSLSWYSEDPISIYSENCCVSICGCECSQTQGIYIDAELKCDIGEILCNNDLEQVLVYKYAELVMIEANFSQRVNVASERDGKNIYQKNLYHKRYQEALDVLISDLGGSDCFICNDWKYTG